MNSKKLVVYYSMDGNTKQVAEKIHKATGADIVEIDTVIPYTGTDEEIVKQGEDEVKRKYMPQIKPLQVNLGDYDTIIIGTPTWWYTMSPAILTFITSNDFAGKTVIPFQTHAGWPGHGMKDIKDACKDASVMNEKTIKFSPQQFGLMETSEKELSKWIETLK
ncbi:flavodoxin [Anaerocolumna xylanovorans]|uniref:Flavodoxin n=1 Tax=Anaerocolumna xylanovorans DSM 12503 TaxID=1121345 RepID=A0A1M7Y0V4_9FIRM|nr:flavodoxin [Anaerocolumna xylanovorans]SHO45342.1 Flavodoxin [Anaerocolumna xylanovorans DSM 12503]